MGITASPDLPDLVKVESLEKVPDNGLVFIDDRIRTDLKVVKGQRVYLVSDLPVSTPLPEGVVGVIPRDVMVMKAIVTLYSEMRESYALGDRLIRSLNEKELAVQEKQRILLRDSKRYSAMVKNATDLIFTLGPNGKIIFSNDTMKKYLKEGRESLIGRPLADFIVDDDKQSIQEVIKRGFSRPAPSKVEVRMHLAKGSTGIFSLMCTPLVEEGRVYALSIICRDITDIRAMHHKMTLQAKDLTHMINGLAHELRNPLTVIGAYMKRIERQDLSRNAESMAIALSGIYSSIQRIEDMIKHIEHYERMVNLGLTYREVSVRRLVEDVLESYHDPFDVSIHGDSEVSVYSDDKHIRDAFERIFENAVCTGSDKFEVSISHRDGYVYVSLRDFGPGINDTIENIFAPFYSSDPGKIGLGLTEARIAMAKIGSHIEVVPQANPGAVFTLKILQDRRNILREE